MKRTSTIILSSTLVILILFGNVAPAFASNPPEIGTFTMGVIEFETNPGEQFLTGNVLHIRNSVGQAGLVGLPWGDPITAIEIVMVAEVDITTGIGSATSKTVDVYANGTVEGTVHTKLDGVGPWTYLGPTFSFTLNGMTVTLTNGATYVGLLTNITAVKHGVSGELKGLETKETATGVRVLEGPLAGVAFAYATGTYTLR